MQFACGVANAEHSEIDDRAQSALLQKKVAGTYVAVNPHGRSAPAAFERLVPDSDRSADVDLALEDGDRLPRFGIIDRQWATAVKVVRSRKRPIRALHVSQGISSRERPP